MIIIFDEPDTPDLAGILHCIFAHSADVGGVFPSRVVASASQIEAWMRERGGADAKAADAGERWVSMTGAPLVLGHPVSIEWDRHSYMPRRAEAVGDV